MKRWIGLLALCLLPHTADAGIIQVFAPEELGPGTFTLETFERNKRRWHPGVSYSADSSIRRRRANRFVGGVTPSGNRGITTRRHSEAITLEFEQPTSAVGMFFGNDEPCCVGGYSAFLDVFNGGDLLDTIEVVANLNDFADQFIGFVSDSPVTSVILRYDPGADVRHRVYLDDLQFKVTSDTITVVAVPGTLSLLLLGAANMRKRRLRDTA